jgi:hypothetical protein
VERVAAPKTIQELAGHSTLTMTLRYMHLAPTALREAVALLEWVLTLPFELRGRLGFDGMLLGAVARLFVDSVLDW